MEAFNALPLDYDTAAAACAAVVRGSAESASVANRYLSQRLVPSRAAWTLCPALLLHTDAGVASFAAMVLAKKVRDDWPSAAPGERASVRVALDNFFAAALAVDSNGKSGSNGVPPDARVLDRASQALAACALQSEAEDGGSGSGGGSGGALASYIGSALALAEPSPPPPARQRVALALIRALALEVFARPHRMRAVARSVMSTSLGRLTCFLAEVAATGSCSASHTRLPLTAAACAELTPSLLVHEAFTTAAALASADLTLGSVQRACPGLLAAAVATLGRSNDEQALTSAGDFIATLVGEAGHDLKTTAAGVIFASAGSEAAAGAAVAAFAVVSTRATCGGGEVSSRFSDTSVSDVSMPSSGFHATRSAAGRQLSAEESAYTLIGLLSVVAGISALHGRLRDILIAEGARARAAAAVDPSTADFDADADASDGKSDAYDESCGDTFVRALVRLCTATVCAAPLLVAGGGAAAANAAALPPGAAAAIDESMTALVNTLLECAQYPCLAVMEVAAEAWPALSAVPQASRRAPGCGPGLFSRVLERLLRGATLPDSFPESGDWEAYEPPPRAPPLEESEFSAFRENVIAPALECAFLERPAAYVDYVSTVLTLSAGGEGGWQATEVALFALRAVAAAARTPLREATSATAGASGSAAGSGGGAALAALLTSLFDALAARAPSLFGCAPVIAAAARAVHAYATWLASARPAAADGAVLYLLDALQLPASAPHAALALRVLLPRGTAARLLTNGSSGAEAAVDAFRRARTSGALTDEHATTAAAALARVVVAAQPPERALVLLRALVDATMMRTRAALAAGGALSENSGGGPTTAARRTAASLGAELAIAAGTVAVLDASAVSAFLRDVWADLQALAVRAAWSEEAMSGLATVAAACISAGRDAGAGMLRDLLQFVLAMHARTPSAACLECLVAAVEAHGGEAAAAAAKTNGYEGAGGFEPTLAALLVAAIADGLAPVFALLQDRATAAGDMDGGLLLVQSPLFTAAFALGTAAALSCPSLFCERREAMLLAQAAYAAFEGSPLDVELCRSALCFVARFFFVSSLSLTASPARAPALLALLHIQPASYAGVRARVDAVAAAIAPPLSALCMRAIVDGSLLHELSDSLAEALLVLFSSYPALTRDPAASAAVAAAALRPSSSGDVLSSTDAAALVDKLCAVAAACRGSPGTDATQPFRDLVADALAICRGELPVSELNRSYGVSQAAETETQRQPGFVTARSLGKAAT